MAMKCTECKKRTHQLTRVDAGTWHCKECKAPAAGYSCIKKFQTSPPSPGTVKLMGFLVRVSGGPDYSRN